MTAPVALTKGSLCSGYGGLDLATPGELRFVAETDPDASAVLAREYPLVRNLGDIREHRWTARNRVGLLTAGFPCQPVSAAGKRGTPQEDARWLWPAVLDAIAQTHPAEVFLENVQNIVSIQSGAILAEILTGLRDARYECRWTVLGACAVGAPHHRHRWYLRGRRTLTGSRRTGEAVRLVNKCGAPRSGGRMLLPTPNARDGGERGTPTREHALRRVANPERSINLEDAVIAYLLPTPRASDVGTSGRRSSDGWRPQLGQAVLASWGKFAEAVALWETITGLPAPEPTVLAPRGGRRLNPALSEWMMGLPPGLVTKDTTRSAALRLAGNGVVPAAAAAAYAQLGGEL